MNFQTVFFDFDGVLCNGRFYKTLLPTYSEVYDWIQTNIFRNKELVKKWMRNEINSSYINQLIVEKTAISSNLLDKLYHDSIYKMELQKDVLDIVGSLKLLSKKVGIITDNMDVFSQITIPNHKLDSLFDIIINSSDYGLLKNDENGKLFDIALSSLGEKFENSLMVDDSEPTINLFKKRGGHGFVYENLDELRLFLRKENLIL